MSLQPLESMKPGKRPYVWLREFSECQFERLQAVQYARRHLAPETARLSRFLRLQIREPKDRYRGMTTVRREWNGDPARIDVRVRPLFATYAQEIYRHVAEEAIKTFPECTSVGFEDGDRLGERRLVMDEGRADCAMLMMRNVFYRALEEKEIKVAEYCRIERDSRWPHEGEESCWIADVGLDIPAVDDDLVTRVADALRADGAYAIVPAPRVCDRGRTLACVDILSLPELVYMNWDEARRPLADIDHQLFTAAEQFDADAITRCLKRGADPNAFDENGTTVLCQLIGYELSDFVASEPGETWEDVRNRVPRVSFERRKACVESLLAHGADVDFAPPEETTPLASAVVRHDNDMVSFLLDAGADDKMVCFSDTGYQMWPLAWDWAAGDIDCADDDEERALCEQTWRILRDHRQAPDGTKPGERPEW